MRWIRVIMRRWIHFIFYHRLPHDYPPLPGKPYGHSAMLPIGSQRSDARAYGMGHYTADAERAGVLGTG